MTEVFKKNVSCIFLLLLSQLMTLSCFASYGRGVGIGWVGGNFHSHGGDRGTYGYGRGYGYGGGYGYAGGYGGGFYYGGGWGGPNIIINVPVERRYVPQCENVEVCDQYDQCWLEQYCN